MLQKKSKAKHRLLISKETGMAGSSSITRFWRKQVSFTEDILLNIAILTIFNTVTLDTRVDLQQDFT